MLFVWDLNNTPGAYMELRLDGAVRLYRDLLLLQPYTLVGLNFGYNTRAYYGWNNFQFGLKVTWKINRIVSIFGGINYSVALTALREIDQGNEVWASAGVTALDSIVKDVTIRQVFGIADDADDRLAT